MSQVLVLSADEVAGLLEMDALIDALAPAMADLSAGRASVPDRSGVVVPEANGRLLVMPGYVPSQNALVTKLVTLFPGNAGTSLPTHQAAIVVFDPQAGTPAALIDGTVITGVRTGACSALSARLLARENASVLPVLGTGVQARSHARAMVRVRPIREIRVAGRHLPRAEALAEDLQKELDIEAHPVGSYEAAVHGADIVCATTHPTDPVVRRAWLTPGTHVTSVGWSPSGREVDDATVADALVCVDDGGHPRARGGASSRSRPGAFALRIPGPRRRDCDPQARTRGWPEPSKGAPPCPPTARSTTTRWRGSTRTGGRRTTCRSGRST